MKAYAAVFVSVAGALLASTVLAVLVGDLGAWLRPELPDDDRGHRVHRGGWMLLTR